MRLSSQLSIMNVGWVDLSKLDFWRFQDFGEGLKNDHIRNDNFMYTNNSQHQSFELKKFQSLIHTIVFFFISLKSGLFWVSKTKRQAISPHSRLQLLPINCVGHQLTSCIETRSTIPCERGLKFFMLGFADLTNTKKCVFSMVLWKEQRFNHY